MKHANCLEESVLTISTCGLAHDLQSIVNDPFENNVNHSEFAFKQKTFIVAMQEASQDLCGFTCNFFSFPFLFFHFWNWVCRVDFHSDRNLFFLLEMSTHASVHAVLLMVERNPCFFFDRIFPLIIEMHTFACEWKQWVCVDERLLESFQISAEIGTHRSPPTLMHAIVLQLFLFNHTI